MRSWSLLKEPPGRNGVQRLAIEREKLSLDAMSQTHLYEEAFGSGRVYTWDEGEVVVSDVSPRQLTLVFKGTRLSGTYELRRMGWYPGNRWLLKKAASV